MEAVLPAQRPRTRYKHGNIRSVDQRISTVSTGNTFRFLLMSLGDN